MGTPLPLKTLFRPYRFKGLELPNRVVMAPMTRSLSPGGVATAEVAAYYRRRAEGGVGLIVTEGTGIARGAALNDPDVPRFHGEAELAAWGRVVEEVHAAGGRIAPQLWHVGAVRTRSKTWAPPAPYDSPSGLYRPEAPLGEPMTAEGIADAIDAFGKGAADAQRLGFDAVELHGAHGYLIDQFFWEGSNVREDAYGSKTVPGRARFAADVLKAARAAVGPDFPVILRVSQWKQQDYAARLAPTPGELEAWIAPLLDAGADIIHASQRRFWEPEFPELGSDLNFAGWIKKLTGAPVITVGSVGLSGEFLAAFRGEGSEPASIDELLRRLERDEFDLVAVGRALLNDPMWLAKIRDGRWDELKPFSKEALTFLS